MTKAANLRFPSKEASSLVDLALKEDVGSGDATSSLLDPKEKATAMLIAKSHGTICGLPLLQLVYDSLKGPFKYQVLVPEGSKIRPGQVLARVRGPFPSLLTGERTLLNLLSILSGIATITRLYADQVRGTGAAVYDTRKTPPGLRALSKYAVRMGGGCNHRMGLHDMVLLKDNHLAALPIIEAVQKARKRHPRIPVMVETETLSQVRDALDARPDYIMFDNMPMTRLKRAVQTVGKSGIKVRTEASGGITIRNIRRIAQTGVDRVSVGALTHSYPHIDLSMEIERHCR